MKVFDFDKSNSDDFAQFSVAMPKSWNEGTITYQVFWTPSQSQVQVHCIWGLQGVSIAEIVILLMLLLDLAVNVTDVWYRNS